MESSIHTVINFWLAFVCSIAIAGMVVVIRRRVR